MDGWVNVLFIVVVAVLYAVGALIKGAGAKAQKREGQNQPRQPQRETWQQKLARKAREMQQAAEARTREVAERMRRLDEKVGKQQAERLGAATGPVPPPQGQSTVHPARGAESISAYEPGAPESTAGRRGTRQHQPAGEPKRATEAPGIEPTIEGIRDRGLQPARPLTSARREPTSVPALSIIDYEDPDALKKAILHYEILGKPLALRDPFKQGAGL